VADSSSPETAAAARQCRPAAQGLAPVGFITPLYPPQPSDLAPSYYDLFDKMKDTSAAAQ
jgi:hypothetical protein